MENETIYVKNKNEELIAVFNKDDKDTLINPRIKESQNSEAIFTFSINAENPKWEEIKNPENLYFVNDKVFSVNFDKCYTETLSENDEKIFNITAYEREKLLSRKFVKAWNSETDLIIDSFMVEILSNGDLPLLNNGIEVPTEHLKGTSGYVLDGLLYGTGWKSGICDVDGVFDFETDLMNIYDNILKIPEIWGGILVFDSLNKIIHHRDEEKWQNYTGYEARYKKNMQSLEKIYNNKIITKLCVLGEEGLNISSVNDGSIWLEDYSYTDSVLEEVLSNSDIDDAAKLKEWGLRKLKEYCKPTIELNVDFVLLNQKDGYELEEVKLNDIIDIISYNDVEGDNKKLRVIAFEYGIWDKSDASLTVGDKILNAKDIIKETVVAADTINNGTLNASKVITYFEGKKTVEKSMGEVREAVVEVKETSDGLVIEVRDKVNVNEIISKINLSPEQIEIDSSKLSLKGKIFNLTSDEIEIKSNNFNVDKQGNLKCKNAEVEGTINATSGKIDAFFIKDGGLYAIDDKGIESEHNADGFRMWTTEEILGTLIKYNLINIHCDDSFLSTDIMNSGITTPILTQTSRKEDKKDFSKFENALEEVMKTDIYQYHLINQKSEDKKHTGFVIGEDFNYSDKITAVDKEGKEIGVDTYAMISVLWQAVKELSKKLEDAQNV